MHGIFSRIGYGVLCMQGLGSGIPSIPVSNANLKESTGLGPLTIDCLKLTDFQDSICGNKERKYGISIVRTLNVLALFTDAQDVNRIRCDTQ